MDTVRARVLAAGAALTLVVVLLVDHGGLLGEDLADTALFGVLAGAVLALVPGHGLVARLAAAGAGLVAAWFGYLLRSDVLPDIPLGRAIAGGVVVVLVVGVAVVSADRLPLWAGVLGAAALVGAHERSFAAEGADALSATTESVTSVLLAGLLACFVVALAQDLVSGSRPDPRHAADDTDPSQSYDPAHSYDEAAR